MVAVSKMEEFAYNMIANHKRLQQTSTDGGGSSIGRGSIAEA